MRARGSKTMVACLAVLIVAVTAGVPTASADWSGDATGDLLAVGSDGALLLYRGDGAGGVVQDPGRQIGSGWGAFTALLATEFSGDGRPDLLARRSDGGLIMYRGNARSGFVTGTGEVVGSGWQDFTALLAPGDFSGDGKPDLLARRPDGALLLYRGDGDSGFTGGGVGIGSGWQDFTALLAPGDFSGDAKADVLARRSDGALLMYRGNGTGGWVTGSAEPIGSGWQGFTALAAGGDFSGDGNPDILARRSDGALMLYRGNGTGGFAGPGVVIDSGWQSLSFLTLVGEGRPPPPSPPAPPSAPLPDGRVQLNAGVRCTPPGGRLRVSLRVRKRRGHPRPKVVRVVFFVRGGPRRVDRRKPYAVRLRLRRPAGSKGRVYARVFFRRPGTRKLRHKTVARRFVMCG
ncbi:MAG TPA: VCBS repeat-containing protein [Solirubrobacteraceae bacterium]|nr:VCBS repeat-containing protein [Solirubrobacteraceae bacterium]